MQRAEVIDIIAMKELVDFIYSNPKVELYEAYSEMEKELIKIEDTLAFKSYLEKKINLRMKHAEFVIYYPDFKGKVSIERIELNPKYCKGKTYRYQINGWGLIQFQLDNLFDNKEIRCRIAVNSQKRAQNWETSHHELGKTSLWNWKIIEKKSRNLIYRLKIG